MRAFCPRPSAPKVWRLLGASSWYGGIIDNKISVLRTSIGSSELLNVGCKGDTVRVFARSSVSIPPLHNLEVVSA